MLDLTRFTSQTLATDPYRWALVDQLFSAADAKVLVETFPRDHFKTVRGYDGEKGYEYEARSLVYLGATNLTLPQSLSLAWRSLTEDLLSSAYRDAMSQLTGVDVSTLPMEANAFHYGRSAWLGPHVDLEDKLVTHVLYFNESWSENDGGCLTILSAGDMIGLMEIAASRVLKPLCGPGELSVGVTVDINHTAPTPLGAEVTATARYAGREGKLFLFEISAADRGGEVGRGWHKRAIVLSERLQSGAAKRVS